MCQKINKILLTEDNNNETFMSKCIPTILLLAKPDINTNVTHIEMLDSYRS